MKEKLFFQLIQIFQLEIVWIGQFQVKFYHSMETNESKISRHTYTPCKHANEGWRITQINKIESKLQIPVCRFELWFPLTYMKFCGWKGMDSGICSSGVFVLMLLVILVLNYNTPIRINNCCTLNSGGKNLKIWQLWTRSAMTIPQQRSPWHWYEIDKYDIT